jgi:hypothetical protein
MKINEPLLDYIMGELQSDRTVTVEINGKEGAQRIDVVSQRRQTLTGNDPSLREKIKGEIESIDFGRVELTATDEDVEVVGVDRSRFSGSELKRIGRGSGVYRNTR